MFGLTSHLNLVIATLVDGVAYELSCIEVLKEPLFSQKLLRLIGILSSFRLVFM